MTILYVFEIQFSMWCLVVASPPSGACKLLTATKYLTDVISAFKILILRTPLKNRGKKQGHFHPLLHSVFCPLVLYLQRHPRLLH